MFLIAMLRGIEILILFDPKNVASHSNLVRVTVTVKG
jgi:hypothetical protein